MRSIVSHRVQLACTHAHEPKRFEKQNFPPQGADLANVAAEEAERKDLKYQVRLREFRS